MASGGMTSNPTIFEKAITGGKLYDDLLNSLRPRTDLDAKGRFEVLAIRDIQDAADKFRPVYESTKRRDGYVSIEVSPYLARDMKGSLEEARRLWKSVGRENVMVKIPGTAEGLPADPAGHQRRHQHQHHLALRPGCLRQGGRGLHRRPGAIRQKRWRREQNGQRGEFLHQPHRLRCRRHNRHPAKGFDAEHRITPSSLKITARRITEERQIPPRAEFHLGDEEREDLSEIAIVATLEIAPPHPSDGWLMTIIVEDEIGPRGPGRGTTVEDEQPIDLETFYSQFIRPERGTATVVAQADNAAAEARILSLLASIESDRHGPGVGKQ